MKANITHHAGKGSQQILPGRSALEQLARKPGSINDYAKATPDVVQNGPSIAGSKEP